MILIINGVFFLGKKESLNVKTNQMKGRVRVGSLRKRKKKEYK